MIWCCGRSLAGRVNADDAIIILMLRQSKGYETYRVCSTEFFCHLSPSYKLPSTTSSKMTSTRTTLWTASFTRRTRWKVIPDSWTTAWPSERGGSQRRSSSVRRSGRFVRISAVTPLGLLGIFIVLLCVCAGERRRAGDGLQRHTAEIRLVHSEGKRSTFLTSLV